MWSWGKLRNCRWSGLCYHPFLSIWPPVHKTLRNTTKTTQGACGQNQDFTRPIQDKMQGQVKGLTHVRGEGGLQARLALLALDGLDERSLLSTNVGPSSTHHEHIKIVARTTGILANQTCLIGLSDGHLQDKV